MVSKTVYKIVFIKWYTTFSERAWCAGQRFHEMFTFSDPGEEQITKFRLFQSRQKNKSQFVHFFRRKKRGIR